jgi:uncharacterized RDD family membrane protein YckC
MADQPIQPTAPEPAPLGVFAPPTHPAQPGLFAAPTQPPAYGAPTGYAGQPAYGVGSPWGPLAGWGTRVAAYLIDVLVQLVGIVPYVCGVVLFIAGAPSSKGTYSDYAPVKEADTTLMVLGGLLVLAGFGLMIGIQIWNRTFKQGRTGQSIGKKTMGIRLVDEGTGQPIGAAMAFVRDLAHILDQFAYVGYLWPLWDAKRQTFADKILGTVVVEVPKV